MKRSPKTARVAECLAPDSSSGSTTYEDEILHLKRLAESSELQRVVSRFLDGLALDPQFHLACRPEQQPTLRKVAGAALARLTGGQQMLQCDFLRCAGTDLVHGICSAGSYVVFMLFFPDDKLGVMSAMFCPPGVAPWNALVRFQEVQGAATWSASPATYALN